MSDALTDKSLMTFGKYGPSNGDHRTMEDIPCHYLMFLHDKYSGSNHITTAMSAVIDYIESDSGIIKKIAGRC